jgi:transposase
MLRLVEDLVGDWSRLDARIENLSGEIETLARQDQHCERLMTVPGIGPIISSAMVAAIGTGDVFSKGRDFGAGPRAGTETNLDGRPDHRRHRPSLQGHAPPRAVGRLVFFPAYP